MAEDQQIDLAPFDGIPDSTEIASYFWHEVVMAEQEAPYRAGQYHGCDGIILWRDGHRYCYLWVDATVDHDMWMGYLLEIRTSLGAPGEFSETRDHLYLAAGANDYFEVASRNTPHNPFTETPDASIGHHRDAMLWFVERDSDTIKHKNSSNATGTRRAVEQ